MIFSPDAITKITRGQKTQTRRINCHNLSLHKPVTITHGRGKHAVYISGAGNIILNPLAWAQTQMNMLYPNAPLLTSNTLPPTMSQLGCVPLQIAVLSQHREPLHSITSADVSAEGFSTLAEFQAVWDGLNPPPLARWSSNPTVTVIKFELAQQAEAVLSVSGH